MKLSPRPPRKPFSLSDSVNRQLNLYAIAAGAAGVGILATTQAAQAEIVYRKVHVSIGAHWPGYWIDLNNRGIHNFWLAYWACGTETPVGCISVQASRGLGSSVEVAQYGPFIMARALRRDARIPTGSFLWGAPMVIGSGAWYNVKNRYLGLKFRFKGRTHYGWARMSVSGPAGQLKGTLTGYAWETIPEKPIFAGETKDADYSMKQSQRPATLGGLALGRK
jgi:hypothetical protein